MKKKDILFLCQFFYPEYVSSATLPFDTALALTKAGYTVDALCGYPKEYLREESVPDRETVQGIGIRRLHYIQCDRKQKIGRLINYISFTASALLHLGKLRNYHTVVVYSNPPILPIVAAWAKKLFGCRLVFVAYDLYPEIAVASHSLRDSSIIAKVMRYVNRNVYGCADRVVALSSEMKDFISLHRPIAENKICVIPNWYEDKGLCKKSETKFASSYNGKFVVSYLGNMGIIQDMDTILDAIRALREEPDIEFLFAGHGKKMEELKQIVSDENLSHVKIHDFLHGQDYEDALTVSDGALVSIREGATGLCCPSKTYGYMMRGIPLLAIIGPSDIAEDAMAGAGVQVRNGDGIGLAKAILDMKNNPDKTKNMRKISREVYLKKYTTTIATKQYIQLFQELDQEPINVRTRK